MRLNVDHPLLTDLRAEEFVLRRFQLTDSELGRPDIETSVDEGTVAATRVLRSSAFRWDDDGCSVYRAEVLREAGIDERAILHPVYKHLARAQVRAIRDYEFTFSDGQVVRPFEVTPSPFPSGHEGEHVVDIDAAHASLTLTVEVGQTRRRQLTRALGRFVFSCEDLNEVPDVRGDPSNETLDTTEAGEG